MCVCTRACAPFRDPLARARERARRFGWTDRAFPSLAGLRVCSCLRVLPPSRPCSHRLILCCVRLGYPECPPGPHRPGGDHGETCLHLPSCGLGTTRVPWREAALGWLLTLHSLSAPWRTSRLICRPELEEGADAGELPGRQMALQLGPGQGASLTSDSCAEERVRCLCPCDSQAVGAAGPVRRSSLQMPPPREGSYVKMVRRAEGQGTRMGGAASGELFRDSVSEKVMLDQRQG